MSGGFIGQCGINAPDAPTIGTPTGGNASICVPFTAPSCTGGGAVTGYIATAFDSSGNSIGATGSSSPVQITGLTNCTAYTVNISAKNSYGASRSTAYGSSVTPEVPVVGQQAYTSAGSYCWTAPTGVSSVSIVAVGGGGGGGAYNDDGTARNGGGGGGGSLAYKNNYSVNPGCSYPVVVGSGGAAAVYPCGFGGDGAISAFNGESTLRAGRGAGGSTGSSGGGSSANNGCDGGGTGGTGGASATGWSAGGGGGAAGYSGNGGDGGDGANSFTGQAGSGGGGGGGALGCQLGAEGGGGVGILGQGSSGASSTGQGQGGSGGCDSSVSGGVGEGNAGAYGGGGGGAYGGTAGTGAAGAVRIIWPGNTRSFPSTCTGNL